MRSTITRTQLVTTVGICAMGGLLLAGHAFAAPPKGYAGKPYKDANYSGGAQVIPGRVQCEYFDLGGEGVAYHDHDEVNSGSGKLNPDDGTYLNTFRMKEGVDTSYTKAGRPTQIDDNPYNLVKPEPNQLYLGWTMPDEWVNYTVRVNKTGRYKVALMYTSNGDNKFSLSLDSKDLTGPLTVKTTNVAEETVKWRQWHHWNKMDLSEVNLEKGVHLLTLKILEKGNMNFDYLEFTPVAAKK